MELNIRPDQLPAQAIEISVDERTNGRLSPENHQLAMAVLSYRGYVILKDALDQPFVSTLKREFDEILEDCRVTTDLRETGADPLDSHMVHVSPRKQAHFWFRKSRWRIFPKLRGPFGHTRLLANGFVVPLLEDLLGGDYYCKYVTSDTCVKGAILQSPHSDISMVDAFVNNAWVPRGYVVNVPVMHCGLHNGPLEVWPGGSHFLTPELFQRFGLDPYVQDGRNPAVERVAEFFPSLKVDLKPGEILIRDPAMWHRGTPNPTEEPRTMITMGFFRSSYDYGYGDPSFNVDAQTYAQLPTRVRQMFAYHYTLPRTLRRKQKELRAKARALATTWVKARLRP